MIISENGFITSFNDEKCDFVIDLKGKIILPGFIDTHSHLSTFAYGLSEINVSEKSEDEIKNLICNSKEDIIICNNYKKEHISSFFLDKFNKPLIIKHQSGHFGIVNNKLLEMIECKKNYLYENEFFEVLKRFKVNDRKILSNYKKALKMYASYGITTLSEGLMTKELIKDYQMILDNKILKQDVVAYAAYDDYELISKYFNNKLTDHFKIGGMKILLDGSPQLKTAYMKKPYLDGSNYHLLISKDKLREIIKYAQEHNIQLAAHANGDMAIKEFIDTINEFDMKDTRPIIIHAQFLDKIDIKNLKKNKIIPSFFNLHAYYFASTHIKNIGFERTKNISPIKSVNALGIPFTIHQDTPVLKPDMLKSLNTAVKRTSQEGIKLCENVDIKIALKGITSYAAYQIHEENKIGQIKEGQMSDFVILNKDPYISNLEEIKILYTIKKGEIIYQNE